MISLENLLERIRVRAYHKSEAYPKSSFDCWIEAEKEQTLIEEMNELWENYPTSNAVEKIWIITATATAEFIHLISGKCAIPEDSTTVPEDVELRFNICGKVKELFSLNKLLRVPTGYIWIQRFAELLFGQLPEQAALSVAA